MTLDSRQGGKVLFTQITPTHRPKSCSNSGKTEREPKPTLDNTAFYAVDEDGETYFYCGGSRLKVNEHFADAGKPVGALIENVINYAAQ